MNVDLPLPERPTIATNSPRARARSVIVLRRRMLRPDSSL
jgi:hypothetical protein